MFPREQNGCICLSIADAQNALCQHVRSRGLPSQEPVPNKSGRLYSLETFPGESGRRGRDPGGTGVVHPHISHSRTSCMYMCVFLSVHIRRTERTVPARAVTCTVWRPSRESQVGRADPGGHGCSEGLFLDLEAPCKTRTFL